MADFGPGGGGSFLPVRQGKGDLPVVVIVQGMVNQEVELDGVHPGLGGFGLSVVFIGTSDTYLSDPQTGGRGSSRGSGLV